MLQKRAPGHSIMSVRVTFRSLLKKFSMQTSTRVLRQSGVSTKSKKLTLLTSLPGLLSLLYKFIYFGSDQVIETFWYIGLKRFYHSTVKMRGNEIYWLDSE